MTEITPKDIDRETLRVLVRRGAQLVDVCPKEEYEQVHLAGATNIPLAMISRHTADRLAWDRPVIVYSRDWQCDLSARAAWRLASLGFTQVYRYRPGKAEWLADGLPAEGSAARLPAAGDLVDMDAPTCQRSERVGEVRARVEKDGWDACVVVNEELVVLGLLNPNDLQQANPQWPAEEAMERDPQTYRLDSPDEEVRAFLHSHPHRFALVTTTDGKLFGIVKREVL